MPAALAGVAIGETTAFPAASQRSRQSWLQQAMDNAPMLDAAESALAAAHEDVDAARGQRYPQVALVGSVGRSKRGLSAGPGGRDDRVETWSVGVQVQMPLFAGGSISADVAA